MEEEEEEEAAAAAAAWEAAIAAAEGKDKPHSTPAGALVLVFIGEEVGETVAPVVVVVPVVEAAEIEPLVVSGEVDGGWKLEKVVTAKPAGAAVEEAEGPGGVEPRGGKAA